MWVLFMVDGGPDGPVHDGANGLGGVLDGPDVAQWSGVAKSECGSGDERNT